MKMTNNSNHLEYERYEDKVFDETAYGSAVCGFCKLFCFLQGLRR